jgi:hypothetical protein
MRKGKWAKVADNQFINMPKSFQKDWEELRNVTK